MRCVNARKLAFSIEHTREKYYHYLGCRGVARGKRGMEKSCVLPPTRARRYKARACVSHHARAIILFKPRPYRIKTTRIGLCQNYKVRRNCPIWNMYIVNMKFEEVDGGGANTRPDVIHPLRPKFVVAFYFVRCVLSFSSESTLLTARVFVTTKLREVCRAHPRGGRCTFACKGWKRERAMEKKRKRGIYAAEDRRRNVAKQTVSFARSLACKITNFSM